MSEETKLDEVLTWVEQGLPVVLRENLEQCVAQETEAWVTTWVKTHLERIREAP